MSQIDTWESLESTIIACRKCPRLVAYREEVARTRRRAYQNWEYWGKPVPALGDHQARLIVVGLAPGAHGANRTGRMFTGDGSGNFLFRALHQAGFSNQPLSLQRGDGLMLNNMLISAICRCPPPGNKPAPDEITNCLPYLVEEIALLKDVQGVVALGRIAFDGVLRVFREQGHPIPRLKFSHGAFFQLGGKLPWLLASYHPSRQNTQTGRLTEVMFDQIWITAKSLINVH